MLSLQQVTLEVARYRWFGAKRWSPLLEDISFELAPGELVALVGGSGEGKSLLLQSLLDLLPDNIRLTGKISLNGSPVDNHRLRQLRGKTFSYVPQGVQALNPMLDVQKHLQRAYQLTGKNWNIHHVTQLLAQNQLESSVLRRYPRQLSGGMAKRVLACHAALSDCRYILADEITAWLDAPLAHQLMQQLQGLCKQGYGVLWVTHDLMLAGQYADRIVSLHRGRVSDNLSREQLLQGEMSEQLKRQWQALPEKICFLSEWGRRMLSCRDLLIRQGEKVLWQNLSFSLRPGERLGLSTPSGSGKTTLGRVLAGWQKPLSGEVLVDGKPLANCGYCPVQLVPQHPELTFNPWRSIADSLQDFWSPDAEMMARLHIAPEWLTRRPGQLSGGELARLALLRALDPRTRFLIADEITAQLDPATQRDVWTFLLELCQRRALGMVVISHQKALVAQVCSTLLVE